MPFKGAQNRSWTLAIQKAPEAASFTSESVPALNDLIGLYFIPFFLQHFREYFIDNRHDN